MCGPQRNARILIACDFAFAFIWVFNIIETRVHTNSYPPPSLHQCLILVTSIPELTQLFPDLLLRPNF